MLSTQGSKQLNELFETFRSKRLASAEKELETSKLDGQMPSEADIEQEFLSSITGAVQRDMVALKNNANVVGYSCMWCDGPHLGTDCEHRGYRMSPPSDLAEAIDEVTAQGYADQALSCYDDNEVRPVNYYHDKASCECDDCRSDNRQC